MPHDYMYDCMSVVVDVRHAWTCEVPYLCVDAILWEGGEGVRMELRPLELMCARIVHSLCYCLFVVVVVCCCFGL